MTLLSVELAAATGSPTSATRAAAVAVALGLDGLVVMPSGGGHSTAIGDLCMAGRVLSASLYSVAAKRFAGDDDDGNAQSLTTWQFTVATAVALAVATTRWAASPGHLPAAVAPRYWLAAAAASTHRPAAAWRSHRPDRSPTDIRTGRRRVVVSA